MDKLIKLSKDFIDGKMDHITFQRGIAELFKANRFFRDELRELAQAILTQAILKGRIES